MVSHVTIPFEDSEIRGFEKTSLNDRKYYAFLGIPYAEPPIGDLRFMPPQPLKNFPKFFDATEFRSCCIQYNEIVETKMGTEDCLNLNIYIPKLPSSNYDSLLPVVVYIHGGAYRCLTANTMTPHLLIEHDLIVVTFNFRLHALGFLNLDLPECPGNVGMKDQLCVLHWVKNNIKWFGGDCNNVTLLGISSGAACAQMLIMSPLNKSSVNKMIALGGNALNMWHINPSPSKVAFELGRKLGYEGSDKKALLKILKSVSVEKLLDVVLTISDENLERPRTYAFRPSVESIKNGALLPDTPINLWEKVNCVSVMGGINENEGMFFLRDPRFAEIVVRHDALKAAISDLTFAKEEFLENMFEEIISFYGIAEKDDQKNYEARLALFTDLLRKHYHTVPNFIRPASRSYSIFNYKFTYCGDHNTMRSAWGPSVKWSIDGTFHADEFDYQMIRKKWHMPENDDAMANTICTLWSNFIKYGNPNGKCSNGIWLPSTKEMPRYLEINENLTMRNEDFDSERAKFWRYLTEKYSL